MFVGDRGSECGNVVTNVKHYGTELALVYDKKEHRELAQKTFWDGLNGFPRVLAMHWFIRYGDPVAESKPFYHHFQLVSKVNRGRPERMDLTIYSDDKSEEAPVARNGNVKVLCHLEASLKSIPTSRIPVRHGKDGLDYYVLKCDIEVVYRSAETDYTLIHDSVRYKTVTAENV
ncbi:hypothetical protein PG996_014445 [Apiospora saccharicola]|uniref:Uncharacterized protein n=1 Tax=Apiospora saccharicola TaxID=335842 RepID=A0ABR1TIB9_9PEZI